MKKLVLIRHAQSTRQIPGLSDFERPLDRRGKHEAVEIGKNLAQLEINPEQLISSPAKRALATAVIIAREVEYPPDEIVTNQSIYDASVPDLFEVVRQIDDKFTYVILVGHNPGVAAFGNYVSNSRIEHVPPCGVFCVELPVDAWQNTNKNCGRLIFFNSPQKL